jgi:hypothetical protein
VQELRELLSSHGGVWHCRITQDEVFGNGNGNGKSALVQMNSAACATEVIQALNGRYPLHHGKEFSGKALAIRHADTPEDEEFKRLQREQHFFNFQKRCISSKSATNRSVTALH